jgi:hypothetical protein
MTMDEIQTTREERSWESWNLKKKTRLENGGIN